MKRLTLAEARQQIKDRELWLERQRMWGTDERSLPGNDAERDFADYDYPGRGLEFEFWEIPN